MPEAKVIGKTVVVTGNIVLFSIFCSSVFAFEGWKFTMTDRSLSFIVAKASHTVLPDRWRVTTFFVSSKTSTQAEQI